MHVTINGEGLQGFFIVETRDGKEDLVVDASDKVVRFGGHDASPSDYRKAKKFAAELREVRGV